MDATPFVDQVELLDEFIPDPRRAIFLAAKAAHALAAPDAGGVQPAEAAPDNTTTTQEGAIGALAGPAGAAFARHKLGRSKSAPCRRQAATAAGQHVPRPPATVKPGRCHTPGRRTPVGGRLMPRAGELAPHRPAGPKPERRPRPARLVRPTILAN